MCAACVCTCMFTIVNQGCKQRRDKVCRAKRYFEASVYFFKVDLFVMSSQRCFSCASHVLPVFDQTEVIK